MLNKITKKVVQQCFAFGYISEDDISGCEYTLLCKIESALFLLAVFLIGLVTHSIFQLTVFTIIFRLLRRHTGGLHLSNYWLCYAGSLLMTSICILWAHIPIWLAACIMIVSDLFILVLAPVNHPNYGGTYLEMAHHRRVLLFELAIVNLLFLISIFSNMPSLFLGAISYAVLCVATLVAIAKTLHQEV